MSTFVLKDHARGYFRGLLGGEDVVWTEEQSRALRFRDREMAELAVVGHCPDASVVRLVKKRGAVDAAEEALAAEARRERLEE